MKVLFAGPSLHRDLPFICKHDADLVCQGPARCGDIARAVLHGAGAIALVDGLFSENAAPWHKEILFALSRGVRVAGAASMGALRAAECRPFGMVGVGTIFRRFAGVGPTDDSDVAQLHAPRELNYLPLTEALVNIEPTLKRLATARVLRRNRIQALAAVARQLHYTDRTYPEIVRQCDALSRAEAQLALAWFETNAVDRKREDALAAVNWLRQQPARPRRRKRSWTFEPTTQWLHLLEMLNDGELEKPVMTGQPVS